MGVLSVTEKVQRDRGSAQRGRKIARCDDGYYRAAGSGFLVLNMLREHSEPKHLACVVGFVAGEALCALSERKIFLLSRRFVENFLSVVEVVPKRTGKT